MSEPTDYAMDHGARVNMVQNASLLFSKERGDWRGAMPMTFEQADAFLSCLRSAGFEIQTKRGKYPKDVLVVHGDYPQAKCLQELTELAESLGHPVVMVEGVSAHERMAEVVRAGVAALQKAQSMNTDTGGE